MVDIVNPEMKILKRDPLYIGLKINLEDALTNTRKALYETPDYALALNLFNHARSLYKIMKKKFPVNDLEEKAKEIETLGEIIIKSIEN